MRVLDRYLIRELFVPIFLCSVTLVFLVLIADLFDNLDALLKNQTHLWHIFRYYFLLTPFAFTQTIAWAVLLGTLYLLVSFNVHNEIVAMKSAGLEITTIVRPLLFLGFLIGIFTFFVGDHLVPQTFRVATEILEVHIEKKVPKEEGKAYQNVTYYSRRNQLHYYRFFNYGKRQVEDAILLWIDPKTRNTRRKMVAKRGTWQEETGWTFENVTEYETDGQGRILGEPRNLPTQTYEDVTVTPEDLRYAASETYFLSTRELKEYIDKLEENHISANGEKVERQFRIAAPWHSLVMILIAIPLLSPTQSKKVIAVNVLLCLGIVFLFHVAGAMALALGKAGKLPPFLSAWLNTIIFSAGGVFFLERANE
jgi:lipopolysaccharide export system permease protein